jgi:hypothetical protein
MKMSKTATDSTICHCICHTRPEVMHIKPCCYMCKICQKSVIDEKQEEHLRFHEKNVHKLFLEDDEAVK